jgi:hypothetical protein
MDLLCPRCGTANTIPVRICKQCGQSLTSQSQSSSTSPSGLNWIAPTPTQPSTPAPRVIPTTQGAVQAHSVVIGHKTWINALAGFSGGLVASLTLWALGLGPYWSNPTTFALLVGIVTGFCVPAALSAFPHLLMKRTNRALQTGARAGILGALVMAVVALVLAQFVTPLDVYFAGQFLAGLLAWTAFGLAAGVVEGLVWHSQQRAILGGIGGAAGGILAFLIGSILDNEGTFVLVGLLMGFGTGLIQDIYKQAWLRIVSGANEGTEVIIDKYVLRIGSSDAQDVDLGLYQDAAIAPRHLEIARRNGTYTMTILGGAASPHVNNQVCQGAVKLQNGDRIQIGRTVLQFNTRTSSV